MLDPNSFDKAVRAAEKLNRILERSNTLSKLSGIDTTVSQLQSAADQADRLLRRNQMLKNIMGDLAMKSAGINRSTLERVRFYDRELSVIKRNTDALKAQIEAKRNERRASASQFQKDIANIQKQISARKALEAGINSKFGATPSTDPKSLEIAEDFARSRAKTLALEEALAQKQKDSMSLRDKSLSQVRQFESELKDQLTLETQLAEQRQIDRKAVFKAQQRDEAKSFIKNQFGGGLIGQITNLGKTIGKLGLVLAPFAIIALLLKSLIGSYRDTLKATIDIGLDASQRTKALFDAQRRVGIAASRGALISGEEMVNSADALSKVFGRIDIPDELVVKSAELTRQLGLSAEEAASIFDFFGRIRGESAAAAATSAVVLKATALSNRANPAQVMRDVAANAANFAKSGRASADELARAAILVRRLGVDLGTISNIADSLVSDFEGALEAQATIGAFAPGFDQTGLMVAAQFGTDEDIARELKASVDSLGTDFDSLPRSFKLSIASGLGVSVDQLAKIAKSNGDALDMVSPDAQAMITAEKNTTNELQKALVNPMDSIEKGIFSIFSFLTGRFGKSAEEKVKGMSNEDLTKTASGGQSIANKVFGGGDSNAALKEMERRTLQKQIEDFTQITPKTPEQKARIERMTADAQKKLDALNGESRAVGGVVGMDKAPTTSLMNLFKKLGSNEVPTILHKGEAVLNKLQMNMLSQLTGAQSGIAKSMTGFVNNFTQKFAGNDGIMGKITGMLGGGNGQGGILGSITKSLGGTGSGGIMGKITGALGGSGGILGSITKSFGGSGGIMGKVSGLLGGGLKEKAAGLVSKIPGLGGVAGSLLKGGGIKGIGGNLLKAGAGKAIGGALGTLIPIPGVGTMLGSALGGLASKGISKLANSRVGKAVTGFLGKSPVAQIGKKYLGVAGKAVGGIGRALGGLFGRKKKPATPPVVQTDYGQMAGMAGMMSYGGSLGTSNYQSGINFGGQQQFVGQAGTNTPMMGGMGNTQALEAKFDTLISLLKSGAIGVNMDGKKVSESLVDANRYG
jgi:hypothetical protein